jgi:hypothetical protein
VSVSELFHRWGEVLARLLVRIPQMAADAGLGAWPIAALALLAGVALLLIGVRLGPLLSGIAGALVGWVIATRFPSLGSSWGIPPATERWVVTAVAGLACAFAPPIYPFLLGVLPGAALGGTVPVAGHAWLGAAAGALVAGALCYAARRIIFAATAAIPGALLVDASLLVLAGHFRFLTTVTARPMLLAALTAVLIVAGTAAQVSSQGPAGRHAGVGPPRSRRPASED